jgi:hypothetical protein
VDESKQIPFVAAMKVFTCWEPVIIFKVAICLTPVGKCKGLQQKRSASLRHCAIWAQVGVIVPTKVAER